MIASRIFVALGAVALAASLAAAGPRCSPFRGRDHGCKNEIGACVADCRTTGGTLRERRQCRNACRHDIPRNCRATDGASCASPSGAFVG
jgi:hypothetical protein